MSTVPNVVRQMSDLVASHIEDLELRLQEQNEKRLIAEGKLEELEISARNLRACQKAYMLERGNEVLGRAVAAAAEALDCVLLDLEDKK